MKIKQHLSLSGNQSSLAIALFALLMLFNVYIFYVGFIASDDAIYIGNARQLLQDGFGYLPGAHWGFRYPLLMPVAALEALPANSVECTYPLISIVYSLAFGAIVIAFLARVAGALPAFSAALLLGSMPLLVIQSSIIDVDIPEALFLFLALMFFYQSTLSAGKKQRLLLFATGIALGFAMLSRETAYGFLLVFGLLFIRGAYMPRASYLWGFAGVMLIIGLEWLYYTLHGESFLYRYLTISQTHGPIGLRTSDFDSGTGNLSDNRLLGPILAIMLNQEFALLFFLAIGCGAWLYKTDRLNQPEDKRLLGLTLFAAVIYFIWLGYSGAIRPLPRYFTFLAILAVIPISLAVARSKSRLFPILLLSTAVATNYLALSVENIHPRFASRAVFEHSEQTGEPIYMDEETARRVSLLASWHRLPTSTRVRSGLPETGTALIARVDNVPFSDPHFEATWQTMMSQGLLKIEHVSAPPKLLIGHILDLSGLAHLLPENRLHWLTIRNPKVTFYRVQFPVELSADS